MPFPAKTVVFKAHFSLHRKAWSSCAATINQLSDRIEALDWLSLLIQTELRTDADLSNRKERIWQRLSTIASCYMVRLLAACLLILLWRSLFVAVDHSREAFDIERE